MRFHPYDLPCILETRRILTKGFDDSCARTEGSNGVEKFTRVIYNELNFINLDDYQMICFHIQEVSEYLYIYIYIPLQEMECYYFKYIDLFPV